MLTNYEDLNILFIEYHNGLVYLVSVMGFCLVELHKTISPQSLIAFFWSHLPVSFS